MLLEVISVSISRRASSSLARARHLIYFAGRLISLFGCMTQQPPASAGLHRADEFAFRLQSKRPFISRAPKRERHISSHMNCSQTRFTPGHKPHCGPTTSTSLTVYIFEVRVNPNVGPTDVRVLCIRSCRLGKPRITSHSFLPTIEPPPLITDGGEQKKS